MFLRRWLGLADPSVRLNPNAMFRFAFDRIKVALYASTQPSTLEIINPDGDNVCAVRFAKRIVLMTPAADDEIKAGENDGAIRSLPVVLNKVKQLQAEDAEKKRGNISYIVPLAESRGRNHWTWLMISGKVYQFYDPRIKREYDLTPMHKIMRVAEFKPNAVKSENYLCVQPITNDTHCGHYTGWSIGVLAQNIFDGSRHSLSFPGAPAMKILEKSVAESERSPEFKLYIKNNDAVWGALGHSTKKDETEWDGDDPSDELKSEEEEEKEIPLTPEQPSLANIKENEPEDSSYSTYSPRWDSKFQARFRESFSGRSFETAKPAPLSFLDRHQFAILGAVGGLVIGSLIGVCFLWLLKSAAEYYFISLIAGFVVGTGGGIAADCYSNKSEPIVLNNNRSPGSTAIASKAGGVRLTPGEHCRQVQEQDKVQAGDSRQEADMAQIPPIPSMSVSVSPSRSMRS